MKPVSVIGLGLSPRDLTATHLALIEDADILVGGKRHLGFFQDSQALKQEISKDLRGLVRFIRDHMGDKSIVVLASGDPLFYGVGAFLAKSLGPEQVRIWPNISAVGAAFSLIREPWHDAKIISMHGRFDETALRESLARHDKIALLTDPQKSPSWLGRFLVENELTGFDMCVLEQLGTEAEQVRWYEPAQAGSETFVEPNLVILKRRPGFETGKRGFYPGMPDDRFEHQRGLITKAEVRAVTLSKLRLSSPDYVLWDLGAGSGSVSVEAALFLPRGQVIAVEQHPDRIIQIRANQKKFGVHNLRVVQAVLPDGLDALPGPDRVFIGGGGRHLAQIIRTAANRLAEDGMIVANTVLLQNIGVALDTLRKLGFQTEITQVQISSGKAMPWSERLEAQNPVWIISGTRQKGGENP